MRGALHLEAAHVLADAGATPDRVAPHYLIGAERGDDTAIDWLIAAASRATNNLTRAELLGRVIELLGGEDPRMSVVAADAIVSLNRAGRPAEAEALAEALRPRLDGARGTELSAALADALIERVDPERALRHLEKTNRHDRNLSARLRAELCAYEGWTRFLTGDVDQGAALAAEAVAAGTEAAAPMAVVIGQVTLSWTAICRGRARDAVAIAKEAVAHRRAELGQAVPEIHLQVALLHEDRFSEAEAVFQAASRRCVDEGRITAQAVLSVIHALALQHAGRLDEARAEADAYLSLCEMLGSPIITAAARSIIGRVAVHRGALAEAEEILGPPPTVTLGADWQLWAAALLQEAGGDDVAARDLLRLAWDGLAAMRFFVSWVFLGPDLCRLSVRLGDRAEADDVAHAVAAAAAGSTSPSAAGAALRCRGLVDRDPQTLMAAVAAYEQSPRVLETARTREEAAELLAPAAAIEQLTAALTTYEAAGAGGDLARVRSALRARGVHLGSRGRRSRPSSGWASLTPTELQVVHLAAAGLTSRQIGEQLLISSLTVGSHLRRVYRKLGVNSRAQLAGEATRHAVEGEPAGRSQ